MTSAKLARLLIEGPRIIISEDAMASVFSQRQEPRQSDPITRAASNQRDANPVDGSKVKIDKKISIFLNRAALRIFSVPSFQTYWKDTALITDGDGRDGRCKIQFVFHRLPEEAHPLLTRLLAAPRNPKFTRFVDDGQARTGVELEVTPEDFGGEDYDYAF